MSTPAKRKFFVDGMPLALPRVSGVGHHLYSLLAALLKQPEFNEKYEMVLVATSRSLGYLKAWDIPGAQYRAIPLPWRVFNRLPATPLMPFMDLILGRGLYLFGNYRSWPLLHSKSITFVYDTSYMAYPDATTKRHQYLLATNVPKWIKRTDKVATLSDFSRTEIMKYFGTPDEKIQIVPCGVDRAEYYNRPSGEVAALKAKYSLPDDYLLFLGNIEPRKNLVRLIRAYRALPVALRSRHPLLLVGGGGWRAEEIDAEVAAARAAGDQIILPTGYIGDTDLPALFSGAVLLAWPSLYEGFGIPPLQAMACGVPVLVGNNSSLPGVCGHAAVYVDAENEADITAKLQLLLTDQNLREELIIKGQVRAQMFGWEQSAMELMNAIREVEAK